VGNICHLSFLAGLLERGEEHVGRKNKRKKELEEGKNHCGRKA
jgi:hypothetical protein